MDDCVGGICEDGIPSQTLPDIDVCVEFWAGGVFCVGVFASPTIRLEVLGFGSVSFVAFVVFAGVCVVALSVLFWTSVFAGCGGGMLVVVFAAVVVRLAFVLHC